jgi:hypothetical protein
MTLEVNRTVLQPGLQPNSSENLDQLLSQPAQQPKGAKAKGTSRSSSTAGLAGTSLVAQRSGMSNQGAVQIQGLSVHRQNDPRWNDDPYKFNSIFGYSRPIESDPANNTLGHLGCTITALTNILNWADPGANVTPQDANTNANNFTNAYARTRFRDLTGGNPKSNISPISTPINRGTAEGNALETKIRQSLQNGHPVLLGIRGGDNGSYPRHTITAAGINGDGKIMVIDPWQQGTNGAARYTTLDQAMSYHGKATGFDMAQEASSRVRESR